MAKKIETKHMFVICKYCCCCCCRCLHPNKCKRFFSASHKYLFNIFHWNYGYACSVARPIAAKRHCFSVPASSFERFLLLFRRMAKVKMEEDYKQKMGKSAECEAFCSSWHGNNDERKTFACCLSIWCLNDHMHVLFLKKLALTVHLSRKMSSFFISHNKLNVSFPLSHRLVSFIRNARAITPFYVLNDFCSFGNALLLDMRLSGSSSLLQRYWANIQNEIAWVTIRKQFPELVLTRCCDFIPFTQAKAEFSLFFSIFW